MSAAGKDTNAFTEGAFHTREYAHLSRAKGLTWHGDVDDDVVCRVPNVGSAKPKQNVWRERHENNTRTMNQPSSLARTHLYVRTADRTGERG